MTTTKGGVQIVLRFQDGRQLKGTTQDFFPNKPEFHLTPQGAAAGESMAVRAEELKAVFFVKSFAGKKDYRVPPGLEEASGTGRRLKVSFKDGEQFIGFTVGCNRQALGFFVTPADPESNNERVYVINGAVEDVQWL